MSKSPISPTRLRSTWRTLRFFMLLLFFAIAVGISFFAQGKEFLDVKRRESLRREAVLATLSLDRSIMDILFTQSRDEAIDESIQPQLDDLRQFSHAESILLVTSGTGAAGARVRLSSLPQRRDAPASLPAEAVTTLLRNTEQSLVVGTGTTIIGYAPLKGSDGNIIGFLGVQKSENTWESSAKAFGFSLGLMIFSSLVLWMIVRRFASLGTADANKQVNANRLALMELATHQLGAPLANFKWWLELLQDPDGKELWGNKEVTMQIQEGVTRMESIIRAMTEANEVAAKGANYKLEVLASLKDILKRSMSDAASHLQRRKQILKIFLDPQLDPVQLDPKLLFGVLQELILNAIDFSPDSTTIEIHVTKQNSMAQISVKDQGYGIPPQDVPHVFEKFTRASNAAQYKPVGNGLGLFIAKGIIQNLGGDMWIESKLGKGTTVFFTLPFDTTKRGKK